MALFTRAFFRRRTVSMATTLTVTATSFALAQDPGRMHHIRAGVNDGNERQFLFASDLALSDMSRAMPIPPSGDVDRDRAIRRPSTWRTPSFNTAMMTNCAVWPRASLIDSNAKYR